MNFFFRVLALSAATITLQSCAIGYITRAAYEESKILINRRDIREVIDDPETTGDEKAKLALVLEARDFAAEMGLTPKKSFTKYTKIDKDVLTWVVMGSKPDAFQMAVWWFPIAGTLPYRGFFDKLEADEFAGTLEAQGLETWVRGSEAFSTLGWFNDPVLTPALKAHETRLVNTVIHETVHATVWIPDNVAFNESLANFVGLAGAVQFFASAKSRCAENDDSCRDQKSDFELIAQKSLENELHIGETLEALFKDLTLLYASSKTSEEKIAERQVIFEGHIAPLRAQFPKMTAFRKINNAEILQVIIYVQKLRKFKEVFQDCALSWGCFMEKMRGIKEQIEDGQSNDPFQLLQELTPTQKPIPGQVELPVTAALPPRRLA